MHMEIRGVLFIIFSSIRVGKAYTVELKGGSNPSNGRIVLDGFQGGICTYDGWNSNDNGAIVVCRMLGYRYAINARQELFGRGSFVMSRVKCTGEEETIDDCPKLTTISCSSLYDSAGVFCSNTTLTERLQISLTGGGSSANGRVELDLDGVKGTVYGYASSSGSFDTVEATVICKTMGFSNGVAVLPSVFGRGNIISLTSSVVCEGWEQTLVDCKSNWGYTATSSAYGRYDIGVICYNSTFPGTAVHLINGMSNTHGRVEITLDNVRGTVGDFLFDNADASVICRMAGYSQGYAVRKGYFGFSTYNQLFSSGTCSGQESSIFQCDGTWGYIQASLIRETSNAAVLCYNDSSDITLSLVSGSAASHGRIEIDVSGARGTVRLLGVDQQVGKVMCRMLGHRLSILLDSSAFGTGSSRNLLYTVDCLGTETSITDCTNSQWGILSTSQTSPAGLVCYNQTSELIATLVDGLGRGNGRLELNVHGFQFSVIDSPEGAVFGNEEARVACRMLGYSRGVSVNSSVFAASSSPALVNNLNCDGWEYNINDCDGQWGYPHVTFNQRYDVGLLCYNNANEIVITLLNGGSSSGRVFINFNNVTGTIADSTKNHDLATSVCRQIGHRSGLAVNDNHYGIGSGQQVLRQVSCPSDLQSSIEDCSGYWGPGPTRGSADFGTICYNNTSEINVTLSGGSRGYLGKVLISAGGTSGYVASSAGSSNSAKVLCRMAGFSHGFVFVPNIFPSGTDRLLVTSLSCSSGQEQSLADCDPALGSSSGPTSTMTALCLNDSSVFSIELVAGFAPSNGRVNVIIDGHRGAIAADSYWDNRDADVICKMARYRKGFAADRTVFAQGGETIVARNLQCTGTENSLHECDISWTSYSSGYDAGVICYNDSAGLVISLEDGHGVSNGRVVVTIDGLRGNVADDSSWDNRDASVFCRMKKYRTGFATHSDMFPQGFDRVIMTSVGCSGDETSIVDCGSFSWSTYNENAGVVCVNQSSDFRFNFRDGSSSSNGRVELTIDGLTTCVDDSDWTTHDAAVVCRTAGYRYGIATDGNVYPQGNEMIKVEKFGCTGSEASLADCDIEFSLTSGSRAGIICYSDQSDLEGIVTVRLIDGTDNSTGKVEIVFPSGFTTGISTREWDKNDARVICWMLGFRDGITRNYGYRNYHYYYLTSIGCLGTERSILACPFTGIHKQYRSYSDIGGVQCSDPILSTTTTSSTSSSTTTSTTTTPITTTTTTTKEPTTTITTNEPTTVIATKKTITTATTNEPTTVTITKKTTSTATTNQPTTVTTTTNKPTTSSTSTTTEPTTTTKTTTSLDITTGKDKVTTAPSSLTLDTGQLVGIAVGLVLFGVVLTMAIVVILAYRRLKKKYRSRLYRESTKAESSTGNVVMDDPTYNTLNTVPPNYNNPTYLQDTCTDEAGDIGPKASETPTVNTNTNSDKI